jgi:hypothetical protein
MLSPRSVLLLVRLMLGEAVLYNEPLALLDSVVAFQDGHNSGQPDEGSVSLAGGHELGHFPE